MSKMIFTMLSIILVVTGCLKTDPPEIPDHIKSLDSLTAYPAGTQPAMDILFIRGQTFSNTDRALIGSMGSIAVDEAGRVFIGDPAQHRVHVVASNGCYLTRIGREVRGPGEFVSGPYLNIISDHLYAFDFMQLRMNVFSLESLAFSHVINLNSRNRGSIGELAGFSLRRLFVRKDEKFLVGFEPLNRTPPALPGQRIDDLYRRYYIMDTNGNIISDKILEQRANIWLTATIEGHVQMATNFPFLGKPMVAVSEDGRIFSAWSKDFLIEVRNPNGKYLRAFYHPYKNLILTREAAMKSQDNINIREAIEYRQRVIQQNDLPETWPALNSLQIDDKDRLWVSTIVDDQEVYQWWLLDEYGKLLARFTWPRNRFIEDIKNGYLYTRETDYSTGLQQIVRYRIEIKEI